LESHFDSRSRHAFAANTRIGLQSRRTGNYFAVRFTDPRQTAFFFHFFRNITRCRIFWLLPRLVSIYNQGN